MAPDPQPHDDQPAEPEPAQPDDEMRKADVANGEGAEELARGERH